MRREMKNLHIPLQIALNDLAVLERSLDRSCLEDVTFDPHTVAVLTRKIERLAVSLRVRLSVGKGA